MAITKEFWDAYAYLITKEWESDMKTIATSSAYAGVSFAGYTEGDEAIKWLTPSLGIKYTAYVTRTVSDGLITLRAVYTVMNNTAGSITVERCDLFVDGKYLNDGSKSNANIRMNLQPLDTPITIASGASGTVTVVITLRYAEPTATEE